MKRLIDTITVHDAELAFTIAKLLETKNENGVKYEVVMQPNVRNVERMDARYENVFSVYAVEDLH